MFSERKVQGVMKEVMGKSTSTGCQVFSDKETFKLSHKRLVE